MNDEQLKRILGDIAAQQPDLVKDSMDAIKAIDAESPILKVRLQKIAASALSDSSVELSSEDRKALAHSAA